MTTKQKNIASAMESLSEQAALLAVDLSDEENELSNAELDIINEFLRQARRALDEISERAS